MEMGRDHPPGAGAGEIITLKDALYGAMVESANDCANAIAQAVSGSLTDFAEL